MKVATLTLPPLLLLAALVGAAERAPAPVPKDAGPIGFAEVVGAALADARALPAGEACRTRYLSASNHAGDPDFLAASYAAVGGYQVNSLSREPDVVRARKVTPWLWAVDTDCYGPDFARAWEAFERDNPYFLVKVRVEAVAVVPQKKVVTEQVKRQRQVQRYDPYGRPYYATEDYYEAVTKEVEAPPVEQRAAPREEFRRGPWVPPADWDALVARTGSRTPVVFADQFFDRTAIQQGRKGNGYRDFLGLQQDATLKDLYELTGFDRDKSVKARKESFAIVLSSGVSFAGARQTERAVGITGGFHRTKDSQNIAGDANPVDRLFEALKFEAQEVVAPLPNGLPVTELADDKDAQQDAAPPTIASNHKSLDNDTQVHVGTVTCFICHRGALATIRDYGRAVYGERTGLKLEVVDPKLERRARAAYLSDQYVEDLAADQKAFDRAYKKASGLDTPELVKAVTEQWRASHVTPVTLRAAAARAGVTPDALRAALRTHFAGKGRARIPGDAILANFALDDGDAQPVPIRLFEERFPVLMLILAGANP